jgi:hypothetical protein
MKSIVNRMVVLFVIATITGAAALANTTKEEVTFAKAVTVNGVLVKEGAYEVRFDDKTNQLTIVKGRKVLASADARLEKVEGTSRGEYVTDDTIKPPVLLSIGWKGGNRAIIVNSGA